MGYREDEADKDRERRNETSHEVRVLVAPQSSRRMVRREILRRFWFLTHETRADLIFYGADGNTPESTSDPEAAPSGT